MHKHSMSAELSSVEKRTVLMCGAIACMKVARTATSLSL